VTARAPTRTGSGADPKAIGEADALLRALNPGDVATFADVGGQAGALALAMVARHDCALALVDLDGRGGFPSAPSDWVAPYRAMLEAHGVDPARISVVSESKGLRPWDVIATLNGFGHAHKIRHLEPVLQRCLHADTVLVVDIRKGSGGFPFLNEFGSCEVLSQRSVDGKEVARVRFTPNPPAPEAAADAGWAEIARGLAGSEGFYRDNGMHSFLYIPRGRTLVVTFDNLDIAMNKREERRPWGFQFIEKQGWSMLGVMANGWTWYRDPWVGEQFDALALKGFFNGFERVVFYGASMGGYAACAFAPAHPGADVVAISPQSTLDKSVVPWETRYKTAWDSDFSGKYGDAAQASRTARRVSLLYDPYEPLDAGHADRFTGPNVVRLRTPLMGHRLGSSLNQMGILSPVILAALNGTLREVDFYRALRARRDFPRYQRELFKRALDRGRPGLARRVGAWVLARGENRFIRQAMQKL
jgi:hypothetical protein